MKNDKREYILPDENFRENMEKVVWPYIQERLVEMKVTAEDGAVIRAQLYRKAGSDTVVCISHGFTEFADKYAEVIYMFLKAGYSVAICEHRSHGYSHRELDNLSKVHVDSYDTFVSDYHCFTQQVKREMPDQRLFLFGHSMGGCIAALYLEAYPEDYEAAVLSSPMLEISSGKIPRRLAWLYGKGMVLLDHGEEYLGSQDQDFKGDETFDQGCGTDYNRWEYWTEWKKNDPQLQTAGGTISWMTASLAAVPKAVRNAKKIRVPVLLLQAGKDNMVLPGGQNAFVKRCPGAKIRRFGDAKHEIVNSVEETRRACWAAVFNFFRGC